MVKHNGCSDSQVIGLYIFYNLVYAAFAYPMGKLSDKIGMKNTLMMGLFVFAVVYTGMGISHSIETFYFLFFLYGVYAAATEGVSKALISNICDKKDVALALGTYAGFNSIGACWQVRWQVCFGIALIHRLHFLLLRQSHLW
jgi:MFS family permease